MKLKPVICQRQSHGDLEPDKLAKVRASPNRLCGHSSRQTTHSTDCNPSSHLELQLLCNAHSSCQVGCHPSSDILQDSDSFYALSEG